jgi:hypothetical protein
MLPIRSLALLLTLLSLVACEQSSNPAEQSKAETAKAQTAVTSKTKAESAPAVSKPSAAEPQPATQPKPKPPVAARTPEPEPAEAKAPLDLSLHPNVFDPLQPLEPLSDLSTPLLPPMFVEKSEPDSPFQLNGSLITNERGDDYWQSVEGAQLQFEFKQ